MEQDFEKLLADSHQRVTAARKTVLRVLKTAVEPLSQAEIFTLAGQIDRTSVYRTIDLFLRLGIVTGVAYGWKQRYELATPFRPHHHHLHCVRWRRAVASECWATLLR